MTETIDQEDKDKKARTILALLEGIWQGEAKTWFVPGEPTDKSPIRAEIKPVLNDTFMLYEYKGSLMGEDMLGIALIGYNHVRKRFEKAWVDNCHTGTAIMYSTSQADPQSLYVEGKYDDAKMLNQWGWDTSFELVDRDHLKVVSYNISPDGEKEMAVEIDYSRVK